MSVQKIQDIPPKIKTGSMLWFPMIAFNTYNGEVPISPKMIPSVANSPASFILFPGDDANVCFINQMLVYAKP